MENQYLAMAEIVDAVDGEEEDREEEDIDGL